MRPVALAAFRTISDGLRFAILVPAGVPERVAMELTGHKTRAVFERYNITSPDDLRDAARRLDAYGAAALATE